MANMLGVIGQQPFEKSAQITPAENGFIVTTIHEVEVEVDSEHPTGEGWKGAQKVKRPVPKNFVFTDIDEALAHIKEYMKGTK